jgi:hypothetical protein
MFVVSLDRLRRMVRPTRLRGDELEQIQQRHPDLIAIQYAATKELLYVFFEWRHKVLTRYLIGVGAIGAFIIWSHGTARPSLWLRLAPFVAGVAFSLLIAMMDRVNQRILNMCYDNGKALEETMYPDASIGIFRHLYLAFRIKGKAKLLSYRFLLSTMYLGAALLFAVGGLLEFTLG